MKYDKCKNNDDETNMYGDICGDFGIYVETILEPAEKADFYKLVERLANIDPHMAEIYAQTLNHK